MKNRLPPQLRDFRCCECGVVVTATKKLNRTTGPGHVKDMWCFRCKKETPHIQISRAK